MNPTPEKPAMSSAADNFINRVAVRIPTFCPEDPEMWFSMVEQSFEAAGVSTDATKFGYILGALEPRCVSEARDIILHPPENPYARLKSELIKRMSSTQEQKTRRLLEHEEI